MPLVRLTYPRGALSPERKRRLAASLTEIVLDRYATAAATLDRPS